MHSSPLLKGVPLMGGTFEIEEENGQKISPEEVSKMLTDYIIQGQVMTLVMGLVDPSDDNWNGPLYVSTHIYAIDYMTGSQLINALTNWNGQLAFDLMSLPVHIPDPNPNSDSSTSETPSQTTQARSILESCLQQSFGFKLAHGVILRIFKVTLGSLWREHDGSDIVPGTCAH
ncbi:putative capsule polysaccharide biosynthesis protein [Phaeomoniella chlamydospora]|uniref:Putative capsule polysaccharide biosynthesis protein n=1 Tax=Phaeomoniella chlamydospora TaxID=158046 RepID=A0A0G2ET99_PHACM|nr:putative capsule polysaccharide biosynthesis protein [Phaeomoniella chlamydospora]